MRWTPEQWAFIITTCLGALGGFVVTIIDAIKSDKARAALQIQIAQLQQRLTAHEQASESRTKVLSQAVKSKAKSHSGE